MVYNKQTDIKWSNDIMTHHKDQKFPDYIGRWGCVVSSLANIVQSILGVTFTPSDMNKVIKDTNGYSYLDDPNTPQSEASNIIWGKFKEHFKDILDIKTRVKTRDFKYDDSLYYIARVQHPKTNGSHYVNILSRSRKFFWCFDVEDGKVKNYKIEDVVYIHEIRSK